jgi:2,3-dihydro-2,3-dihydroxybenzoate dehydrogenase
VTGIEGTVALVTGAGQGIGAAVAHTLARAGARVAVTDRDADAAAAVAAAIGAPARAYPLDVTDGAQVEAVVAAAEAGLGPLDTLVSVAGILRTGPVVDCSDADWDALLAVNATGPFRLARAAARRMLPRGRGSIVTVASNAAGIPRAGMAAYGASKAAATMLTKSLGLELAPHGIRCNVVAPGSTDTPMQRSLWADERGAAAVVAGDPGSFRTGIPLGRIATAQDIADTVAFLVSDQARHITMQDIYVDGGATLRA